MEEKKFIEFLEERIQKAEKEIAQIKLEYASNNIIGADFIRLQTLMGEIKQSKRALELYERFQNREEK